MPDIRRALLNSFGYAGGTFVGSLVIGAMILSSNPQGYIVFPVAWTLLVTFDWTVWSIAIIYSIIILILALMLNFSKIGPKKKA